MTEPSSREPSSRAWSSIHHVVAFATVVPLFLSRHPPFSDMPEHLALVATMRHWWDPSWQSQTYFQLEGIGRTPYWLYHVIGALLAVPLRTPERAVLALTVLSGLGFPYALRALARSLDRDPRVGLLGAPLFWNLALAEGFMSYVASIPVALWALASAIEQMRSPTLRRGVVLCGLTVALLYLHVSSFVFFCLASTASALVLVRDVGFGARGAVARLASRLPWLPVAMMLGGLFAWQSVLTHPNEMSGEFASTVRFIAIDVLVERLFAWMHDFWRSPWDDRLALVLWGALAALLYASIRWRKPKPLTVVAALIFSIALGLYLFMPTQVSYAFLLDLRMAPIVGMTVGLLIHTNDERLERVAFGAIAAAGILMSVHGAHQMWRFEQEEAAHFDLLLRNMPPGKRLLMLVFRDESRLTNIPPFLHYGSYYRARYGGIASFSFSELPHWPLRYRPETAPPKKAITFWSWNPCRFKNLTDGPYYDYVLTRGDVEPFANHAPGPKWMVIGAARGWRLYAKTGEEEPVIPDRPALPTCAAGEDEDPESEH
ncbi:MAG TPA: hypothetical protein VM925_22605 [Labilithrix sp.]|nr:hypothetical protein [Labilithrix sp.]